MFRQSPSRNQRSKGFRIKHGLQIFLLVAICFWLLYQVKHSHDKKKAFDENAMKLSAKLENEQSITKFGRKYLHPRVEEKASENEIQGKEEVIEGEEEENKTEEEDENKPEEEEESKREEEEEEKNKNEEAEEEEDEEEENKTEETEEERRGAGDDAIDEQDQERAEEEAERGAEFLDEEEKDGKEETEEGENEEKAGQKENVGSSGDLDHDRNTQEAREENYKGDDASSAVVRDTQVSTTEAESGNLGDPTKKELVENTEENKLELDKIDNTENITSDKNNSDQKSVASEKIEEKGNDGSQASSTIAKSDDGPEVSNTSMAENVLTSSSLLQNRTYVNSGSAQNQTGEMVTSDGGESKLQIVNQAENSNITAGIEKSDSKNALSATTENAAEEENADVAKGQFSDTSNNAETVVLEEQSGQSSLTAGEENNSLSSGGNKNKDGAQIEKAERSGGTEESDDSKASSTTAGVIESLTNESGNHIILRQEKEARADLGTLPEIETEGVKSEDAAVE